MTRIDNKHHLDGERIIKTGLGVQVDRDAEPGHPLSWARQTRAPDAAALPQPVHRRRMHRIESMDDMIRRFQEFSSQSPTMKQPGCTRGK